jgi:hypothetical protein
MNSLSANTSARWSVVTGWIARFDDGRLLGAVFYGLVAAVVLTVFMDYRSMTLEDREFVPVIDRPVLPPAAGGAADGSERPSIETPAEKLRDRASFTLEKNGILKMQGTIEPGSADIFTKEIDRIGEYIKQIELDSPGGSVEDALRIGQLVRERKFQTRVAQGRLCASSCPLVFAGGVRRTADPGAAIGVHQVFSAGAENFSTEEAVVTAQRTTAKINRHLIDNGVDPALWLHALDTPPDQLYYLTHEELERYRLVSE